jgi:hypothetical protein
MQIAMDRTAAQGNSTVLYSTHPWCKSKGDTNGDSTSRKRLLDPESFTIAIVTHNTDVVISVRAPAAASQKKPEARLWRVEKRKFLR